MSLFLTGVLIAACVGASPLPAQEPGWATLRGRIVVSGDVPPAEALVIERDAEICGDKNLVDESLVVHPENRVLRYVAIWIDSRTPVPVHPERAGLDALELDNANCRFEPRMLAIRTGQKLVLKNSDPVPHNAAVYLKRSTPFNEVIPTSNQAIRTIEKPETLPVRVDCSIHAWMKAWIIVLDHPYAVVTDANGAFEMKNVPAGTWKVRFWQERPGSLTTLQRDNQPVVLEKGAMTLELKPGQVLDLGDLAVSADELLKKKK